MKEYICIYDEDDMMYILNPYVAQNTELIRCKDCKWNKADKWVDGACVMNGMYGRTTDNYCSLAERK